MDRRKKSRKRFWVLILVLLAALLGGSLWWWTYINSPADSSGEVKAFVVEKGEGVDSIVNKLKDEGFIRSEWIFKNKLKASGIAEKIQAGTFKISPSMSADEIIQALAKPSVDGWVTLIEGWRVEQMAKALNQALGIDEGEFLDVAKEGYMFPDTYLFNKEANASDIAATMKDNFNAKYSSALQSKIKALGLTPEQGVILASMVEREGRSDKVRTEVASVLLKRLKMGMKLDIDSTVQYAKDTQAYKNGTLDKFWQPISQLDYEDVKSPYNTYLNNGLPPAPIANPSLSSLEAVADADPNTPYIFYYHDSAGNSHYARTLEEHNANVANFH